MISDLQSQGRRSSRCVDSQHDGPDDSKNPSTYEWSLYIEAHRTQQGRTGEEIVSADVDMGVGWEVGVVIFVVYNGAVSWRGLSLYVSWSVEF